MSEKQTCGNCRYWREGSGECRRVSPFAVEWSELRGEGDPIAFWQTTQENEWCGEWCATGGLTALERIASCFEAYLGKRMVDGLEKIPPEILAERLLTEEDDE